MRTTKVKQISAILIVGILAFSVIFAGCTSNQGQNNEELSGEIIIDGSSTVYPVSQAMAEEFKKENSDVIVSVSSSGTGGGFQKFVEGETDINDASRPIKESEAQNAKDNDIEYVGFKIASDGVTVVTKADANWYESMSKEQLAEIWGPEDPPESWNEVKPDWPNEEIDLYGPTSASGTFDFFTENVVGEEDASRTDYQPTEDDNFIIEGVKDSKYAMGYLGYAFYSQNKKNVRAVPVNGVEPSVETISSGEYLLSRPLFIYVNIDKLKNKPALQEFVKFYLEKSESQIISQVGYVPSTEEVVQEQIDRYDKALNDDYELNYGSTFGINFTD